MTSGEMSEPYGYSSASALLEKEAAPSAFVTSSIVSALGIRRAVEERGLRMGKDVSIMCFDDAISYLPNGSDKPVFTAVRSSVRAAGRRCAEMLIDQINAPGRHPVTELWEAELVIGTSTGTFT
jgi:LacI family transcriptional regulator